MNLIPYLRLLFNPLDVKETNLQFTKKRIFFLIDFPATNLGSSFICGIFGILLNLRILWFAFQ